MPTRCEGDRHKKRCWIRRSKLLLIIHFIAFSLGSTASAMPGPGDLGPSDPSVIGNTGAAHASVPIALPPGPGGSEPNLDITYSSHSGDGAIGVGWHLEIPEIRCSTRFGVPEDLVNCDTFELNDTLLVEDPANANFYRTFIESFRLIRRIPSLDRWIVHQPDGTKLYLGTTAAHRVQQNGHTVRWLLQRAEDAFGNPTFFHYDTAIDPGSAYLTLVNYGYGATSTGAGPRKVVFQYQDRPDDRLLFTGGLLRQLRQRLREIQVIGHDQVYKRYVFGYELATVSYSTTRSRLSWVQEFGMDCTNLSEDPEGNCEGLPKRTFEYRDPNDVPGAGAPSSLLEGTPAYRVPFGSYSPEFILWNTAVPQLIGDINGDGLPDRLELRVLTPLDPGTMSIWINTGEGFHGEEDSSDWADVAATYTQSFESLKYDKPRYEFEQIPASILGGVAQSQGWNGTTMYAMCSLTLTTREATLSEELYGHGVRSKASNVQDLLASQGNPSPGFFEPFPSVKLMDVDQDGLADLVISAHMSGMARHYDCATGQPLAQPVTVTPPPLRVVFRNTGTGWVNDAAAEVLAENLPPFEEIVVRSTYQTELDDPAVEAWRESPCGYVGVFGFEEGAGVSTHDQSSVCHAPIDLAPQFADFNGDGYPDVAVLERDDPDAFFTGDGEFSGAWDAWNKAVTRVWIQRPDQSPRWQRAARYDLPSGLAMNLSPTLGFGDQQFFTFAHIGIAQMVGVWEGVGVDCNSWRPGFLDCGPSLYRSDLGVRFADLNGDGLTDVVWRDSLHHPEGGALLNMGDGSDLDASSAWCASRAEDGPHVGMHCPEAAAYVPPEALSGFRGDVSTDTLTQVPMGMLADLNGDGLDDFFRYAWGAESFEQIAWIHAPGGGSAGGVWEREDRFDLPSGWPQTVTNPLTGGPVNPFLDYFPSFQAFDIDGDGSSDLVGDGQAFLSKSQHSDRMRSMDNGRGGIVEIEYASAIQQRDDTLENEAIAQEPPGTLDGPPRTLWRPLPVVSRIILQAPERTTESSEYAYAHPRFCHVYRSDLGFRLVETAAPDGVTTTEAYFYQDHGRAGQTWLRVLKDGGAIVHVYEARWDLVPDPIPGTIAHPDVFRGRMAWEEAANRYGAQSGAIWRRELIHDDEHGYNFVGEVRIERPTGVLVEVREADSDLGAYVIGRIGRRTLSDGDTETILADTILSYIDLNNNPTGPKIGGRTELIGERGIATQWLDVERFAYDDAGNLIAEWTPSPDGNPNGRTVRHCYDGDQGGWCAGLSPAGQTSRSVRVATQDPLGHVLAIIPDPASGIIVGTDSDYTDEPATALALDAFGRPELEYVIPEGGDPVLVGRSFYDDTVGVPPLVESHVYTDEAQQAAPIVSARIYGAMGGIWKEIAATPSGYFGTATFTDHPTRQIRTTLPFDCGQDLTCAGLVGATEPLSRQVATDSLGRPIRIDTENGFSVLRYSAAVDRGYPGGLGSQGPFDAVLEKNGKGDLLQRIVDDDRTVWVDECHIGASPSLTTLASVSCGYPDDADTTLYTYEATGELHTSYDALAAQSGYTDPDHFLRYTYDTLGRVVRIEDPDLTGTGAQVLSYSDAGTIESTVNARGQTRVSTYDVLGRLTSVTTPGGDDYTIEYRTEERQRWRDWSDVYYRERDYDAWGRVERTSLTIEEGGLIAGPFLTDFGYDVAGRPVEQLYPESTRIRYEYDGAYLVRVCDLGTAADCSDPDVVEYVSDVDYDTQGRRHQVHMGAGVRELEYDGPTSRVMKDRFDASSAGYYFERNFNVYDGLGNAISITGSSEPGDVGLDESFSYDSRNRLASWTKGVTQGYDYDELGNLILHAGQIQTFGDEDRPHAVKQRADGASYTYDHDGNVKSIVGGGGSSRHFTFDAANQLACIDATTPGGCGITRIHYDVDGQKVLDDLPGGVEYKIYVDSTTRIVSAPMSTQIAVHAFGERVAYKRSSSTIRAATVWTFELPFGAWSALLALALASVCLVTIRAGVPVVLVARPARAGLALTLAVVLVLAPLPPAPSRAGGGGGSVIHWELADRLGTGLVMVDETGARLVHRTFTPFGAVHEEVDDATWLPRHYGGHLWEEHVGLYYMQARWMDPQAGTFMSVDPVVATASDPQFLNAYAYARNNPVSYMDPTGACPILLAACLGIYQVSTTTTTVRVDGEVRAEFTGIGPAWKAGTTEIIRIVGGGSGGTLVTQSGHVVDLMTGMVTSPPGAVRGLAEVRALNFTAVDINGRLPTGAYIAMAAMGFMGSGVGAISVRPGSGSIGAAATATRGIRYGPLNPGPLADDIAATFRSGSYTARTLDQPTTLYRVIGDKGNPTGSFWTATEPRGPLQSVIDLGLDQNWGNPATQVIRAQIPSGTTIYEGAAAAQRGLVGGGNQVYIPRVDPRWLR